MSKACGTVPLTTACPTLLLTAYDALEITSNFAVVKIYPVNSWIQFEHWPLAHELHNASLALETRCHHRCHHSKDFRPLGTEVCFILIASQALWSCCKILPLEARAQNLSLRPSTSHWILLVTVSSTYLRSREISPVSLKPKPGACDENKLAFRLFILHIWLELTHLSSRIQCRESFGTFLQIADWPYVIIIGCWGF